MREMGWREKVGDFHQVLAAAMNVRSPGVMVTLAAAGLLPKGLSNQGACLGMEAAAGQALPPKFCTEAAGGVLLKKAQSIPSGGI